MNSLVPLRNRFVCTIRACQLVVNWLVVNSGLTSHPSVPVEVRTRLLSTARLRIRKVGGEGGSVMISPRMVPSFIALPNPTCGGTIWLLLGDAIQGPIQIADFRSASVLRGRRTALVTKAIKMTMSEIVQRSGV